ncbi:MAG: 2Fe-2S iron-sulfur cluster-binding protein [Flavobacteriaceae bacterium]|nr:2Fe-2S iron-sulfur cluster binding domain-containing protein [Flavobacteriaceae bacterium]|tara:strand:- start:1400 stop:1684 length:285 start_codon:yes stop_codon:yes gene_type:complete
MSNTKVTLILDGEEVSFEMSRDEVVLDIALSKGIDVPYSCQGGVCLTCMGKIEEGKADMIENQLLSEDEINDGCLLTCQAVPKSETLKINYDDV